MPTESLDHLASELRDCLIHAAGTAIDVLPGNEYDAQAWLELDAAWAEFCDFVYHTGFSYMYQGSDPSAPALSWLRAHDRTSATIRKIGTGVGALLLDRDNGKSAIRAGVKALAYQFGKLGLGLDTPQDAVNKAHARDLGLRTGESHEAEGEISISRGCGGDESKPNYHLPYRLP